MTAGLGFRLLAANAARTGAGDDRLRSSLQHFPTRLGLWSGTEVPVDARLRAATDTDELLNRRYTRTGGAQQAQLCIAYGSQIRQLAPHRPEICYPAAGWVLDTARETTLRFSSAATLPARTLRFSRAGLGNERIVVICYYILDGQPVADADWLISRLRDIDYVLQVQVMAAAGPLMDVAAAERTARAFAEESAPAVWRLVSGVGDEAAAHAPEPPR